MTVRHPLMESFDNGQALIAASQVRQVEACLQALLSQEHGQAMLDDRAYNDDGFWPDPTSWKAPYRPYVIVDGILQIPVKGVLLHEFGYADGNWATGYVYIQRAFERGVADFKAGLIKGIALICDTPGGMVAGCFDCVDNIFALKEESGVPVWGFAHESAYSAGYAVISVSDVIYVSRTGGVGSIGVVTSHIDASGMMQQIGLKRTYIFAGKHKVDGNSDGPLPADVQERIQARIDELYDVFVASVARNRPQLKDQAIRDTEALTFTATEALSNKLADHIGSLNDALVAFAADLSSDNDGDDTMSALDAAAQEAAITAARAEGHATGLTEGATAERARITTILGTPEAKERPKAALAAALRSPMSAEDTQAFLADLPKEAAEAPTAPAPAADANVDRTEGFDLAMEQSGNPRVGADAPTGGEGAEKKDDGSDVLALCRAAGLHAFPKKAAA